MILVSLLKAWGKMTVSAQNTADKQTDKTGGTVGKAVTVLDLVAAHGEPVRFMDLLADSPFPKATLFRLLQTLVDQNMLAYDPDRQTYGIGLKLVRLAHSAWKHASLAPIARPHVDKLSTELGMTVHLAQLEGSQVLYIDKRNALKDVPMYSAAGKVGPGYCTGVGKAMMAFLPEAKRERAIGNQSYFAHTRHTLVSPNELRAELEDIRQAGYSFDREEHEPGIICIGVPILASTGRVIGGMSITQTTTESSLEQLAVYAPRLKQAAADIASEAESWGFPEQNI